MAGTLALKLCLHSKQHCFYLNWWCCFFKINKNSNVFLKVFLFTSHIQVFLFINCLSWRDAFKNHDRDYWGKVVKAAPPYLRKSPSHHLVATGWWSSKILGGNKARRERTLTQGVARLSSLDRKDYGGLLPTHFVASAEPNTTRE